MKFQPLKAKALAAAISALGLAACTTAPTKPPADPIDKEAAIDTTTRTQPAPKKVEVYKAPISSYATRPYTAAGGYSNTVKKYGPRLAELQAYREKAAEVVSGDKRCDEVTQAEISSMRGGLNDMHFWVDCSNGQRFRFSEAELDRANVVAVSEADKVVPQMAAVERCKDMVYESATHPSTVSFNPLSLADPGYRTFDQTGAAEVMLAFSAKNSFGTKLKFGARCLYQSDGSGEITIKERNG
jgi:hypothetical protein